MSKKELELPESTFERQSEQRSWTISVVFHVAVMLLLFLITCNSPEAPEDLTEIQFGGGGIPGLDMEQGPTPKGVEDGGNKNSREVEPNVTEPKTTAQPPTPTSTRQQPTNRPSENTIPAESQPRQQQPTNSQAQPSTSTPSSSNSSAGTNNSDKPQGTANGTGDKPAGGAGGPGVGSFSGGGIGRDWIVSPSAAARGSSSNIHGTVTLRFTVMPDGRVTNITKAGGSTELFSLAKSLLSRARAMEAFDAQPVTRTVTFSVK